MQTEQRIVYIGTIQYTYIIMIIIVINYLQLLFRGYNTVFPPKRGT